MSWQAYVTFIAQHEFESSNSNRDKTNMRGLLLLKNPSVPTLDNLCHRRSSPSIMSAAIKDTICP
jgi:hypothetical protein